MTQHSGDSPNDQLDRRLESHLNTWVITLLTLHIMTKLWLYKVLAELRKGEMLMTFTGGERCKRWVGGFESFFSIHFSGFSYEFGALRYEFGALREAEEICCQAFNVFLFLKRSIIY